MGEFEVATTMQRMLRGVRFITCLPCAALLIQLAGNATGMTLVAVLEIYRLSSIRLLEARLPFGRGTEARR